MRLLLYLVIFLLLSSCKKGTTQAGEKVEIYLLKSFKLVPGKCLVDPSNAVLEDHPAITNDDILKYSSLLYEYRLSIRGIEKIRSLDPRTAFAITVDKEVIYFGFYIPPIISSTCDNSIVMDISMNSNNAIYMQLGYHPFGGAHITDDRNHPKLLATLKRQGKLK